MKSDLFDLFVKLFGYCFTMLDSNAVFECGYKTISNITRLDPVLKFSIAYSTSYLSINCPNLIMFVLA